MAKIDSSKIEYLALEGGGGKGVVYSGAIGALQEVLHSRLRDSILRSQETYGPEFLPLSSIEGSIPLFPIWNSHPTTRALRGIAGSSAGAITAFFLAMGLSHSDLMAELRIVQKTKLAGIILDASEFELFFESPQPGKFRQFADADSNIQEKRFNDNMLDFYKKFLGLMSVARSVNQTPVVGSVASIVIPIANVQYKLNKFLLSALCNDGFLTKRIFLDDLRWPPAFLNTMNTTEIPGQTVSAKFWDDKMWKGAVDGLAQRGIPTFGDYANLAKYLYCLINDRGLFSGLAVRKYLASKLQKYVIDKAVNVKRGFWLGARDFTAETMTFKQFFQITGVDLVVSGTNIVQNCPVYFSLTHTPDFPIVDAVGASMSIPGLFKPVKIKGKVNKGLPIENFHNMKYYGMIVDGGMLNNYPINAFNGAKLVNDVEYHSEFGGFVLQSHPQLEPFTGNVLGLRLQQLYRYGFKTQEDYHKNQTPKWGGLQSETPAEELLPYHVTELSILNSLIDEPYFENPFGEFLGQILETFAYPAEMGQIRSEATSNHTLLLDTGAIGITDFSTIRLDGERKSNDVKRMKEVLINNASNSVKMNMQWT